MRALLLAGLFAGCSVQAAPTAAVVAKPKMQASQNFGGASFITSPVLPGQTPVGWVVKVQATAGGLTSTYYVPRNPDTTNAEPGGETMQGNVKCGVQCSPGGSRLVVAQLGGATTAAKGFAGGGTSFATSGNVEVGGGGVIGTFTATVQAVP